MNNTKLIAQKIDNIKKELCSSWSEKITRALFPKNGLTTPRGTPRNDKLVEEPKAPTPEQVTEQTQKEPSNDIPVTTQNTDATPTTEQPKDTSSQPTDQVSSPPPENSQPDQAKTDDSAAKTEKKQRTLVIDDEIKERTITVEFDWTSFNDLFSSLINEGAADVIDTIMESLVSKDCAISLLSSLLDHCKPLSGLEGV